MRGQKLLLGTIAVLFAGAASAKPMSVPVINLGGATANHADGGIGKATATLVPPSK